MEAGLIFGLRGKPIPAGLLLLACAWLAVAGPAFADQEASNVAHVAAGPYGRCYAKSVPAHIYDPDGARQQGVTEVYRVGSGQDELVHTYDWFSQQIFLRCSPTDDIAIVRVGPWNRGHDPRADHLAVAFYRGGAPVRSYSTLEIAGEEEATDGGISRYRNASASVSHYTVFETGPEMIRVTTVEGAVYSEDWIIRAVTVDGRVLSFNMETGMLQPGTE
jgi:hypothetical protein